MPNSSSYNRLLITMGVVLGVFVVAMVIYNRLVPGVGEGQQPSVNKRPVPAHGISLATAPASCPVPAPNNSRPAAVSAQPIVDGSQASFQQDVLASTTPVMVDFWASWCGPCQQMSPIVESFAQSEPSVKLVKINVDDNKELAQQFNIEAIPTIIFFRNGQEYSRSVGLVDSSELARHFQGGM